MKRRLNIFVDESGDFGFSKGSSELYGVSFTIHESDNFIENDVAYLKDRLKKANYDGMIHLADLVARRGDYADFDFKRRKDIFWSIFYFSKRVKVKVHTIILNKKFKSEKGFNRELAGKINDFLDSIGNYIDGFEKVVIYYDNGQGSLGRMLDTLLITKHNVEHRVQFDHKEKRLFQISDMLTFVDKMVYKYQNHIPLTKAEQYFFKGREILRIIKQLESKRWQYKKPSA